jgi:predicted N-acyltransferase
LRHFCSPSGLPAAGRDAELLRLSTKNMKDVRYKIVDSILKINGGDWDSIFGNIPEGYDFYHTLEKSGFKEFSFYYLVLYQNENILSIAPLFVADLYLDIVLKGMAKKIVHFIRRFIPRFFVLKTLFCGSPFGETGVLGIRKGFENTSALIHQIAEVMGKFSRKNKIPFIVFKDFLKDDTFFLDSLKEKGFLKIDSFPSVRMELNFHSLEHYFQSLTYSTRKDLQRKIKKAYSQGHLTIKTVESVEDIIDDVYRLYLNTYHASEVKFEFLTKEFFINVSHYLKPHTQYFLYYVGDRLAAFNLCFVYDDLMIDKFIGFDYEIARPYSLYFVSWCFNIEWCLKHSIQFYQTGQTDYEPKTKLGGSLVPLYAYFKHNNFFFNLFLKLLAIGLLKPNASG